jgi:hypothetical protein
MVRNLFVALGLAFVVSGHGTERPSPSSRPELMIQKIGRPASIEVRLSPTKNGPTRVWRSSNSWGAANWRVLILRGDSLLLFREDPDQTFSRNFPVFDELKTARAITLNIKSETWIGPIDAFEGFQSGDKVIAIYDVPVTLDARKLGVWYGTVSAIATVD